MTNPAANERWWDDAQQDPVHTEAADWFTRLQDPKVSLEETLEWQRWMARDGKHAHAFERLNEAWRVVGQLSPRPEWKEPVRARPRFAFAMAASVLVLVAGAALFAVYGGRAGVFGARSNSTVLATAVGEIRSEWLADGSRVTLGGDSRVEIALGEKARRIELEQGEAFFKVAKDSARPFVVRAGDATVTAVGTEFNVRRGGDHVVVAVVEGRVLVEPSSGVVPMALLRQFKPKLRPVRVSAGEQTVVVGAGVEEASALEDPGAATSWQSGQLAFRGEPLRYVLEDVNRYAAKPIVIEDRAVGDLEITGTVSGDNVAGWVSSLESAFGLEAVEEPDRVVLRRK